jgi:hypothetical protein
MWRQTVDLIVLLSIAHYDATGQSCDGESDGLAASSVLVAGQDPDARLLSRVLAAHETLAEIEEAIDRLKGGDYGICERCEQPMPAGWLAESPQVRSCPGCALEQLRWQRRSAGPGAAGQPAGRRLTVAG